VACVLNPATGREARWGEGSLRPAVLPRQVVVLGAGPAGLRAAATAAARGHSVTVHEREPEPGGHLRDLAWLPTRSAWLRAVEDLVGAVERHGAELRLVSEPDAEALVAAAPDVVLVATGAAWDASGRSSRRPGRDGLPGAALDLGTALGRCREDPHALGRRVLIVEEAGIYAPLGLAEALAEAGVEVELATPAPWVGRHAAEQLELPHVLPRLRRLGVRITPDFDVGSIDSRTVDTVVLAMERLPRDELLSPLAAALPDVRAIGDARAPRATIAVIYEAEEVARAL